jgi:hypothetical protein
MDGTSKPRYATRHDGECQRTLSARLCGAVLDNGLQGMHSAADAWPAEQPARGLCHQAVGSGIRPTQHRRWQASSGDGKPRHTIADAMAQSGRCTRRHPRDEGVVMGGWRSGGNCGGNASERAAGEDLGEDGPDTWAPSVRDGGTITGWQASSRVEMGRGRCSRP